MGTNLIDESFFLELEKYMSNSKSAEKISENEAVRRNAVPVSREFIIENGDVHCYDDKSRLLGHCALRIEDVFTRMFLENKILFFTGYKITELPETFGIKFKVETLVVKANSSEWH